MMRNIDPIERLDRVTGALDAVANLANTGVNYGEGSMDCAPESLYFLLTILKGELEVASAALNAEKHGIPTLPRKSA